MKVPAATALAVAFLITISPAAALEIEVDLFWRHSVSAKAIAKVLNDDEPRGYASIQIRCTFLVDGKAATQGINYVANLHLGEVAYAEVIAESSGFRGTFDSVHCRANEYVLGE